MFMRYRGGGVGHAYMRAIEVWLAETGWGSDDILELAGEGVDLKEDAEDAEHGEESGNGGNLEVEVPEDEAAFDRAEAGQDNGPDADPDHEYTADGQNEETAEGEYGYGRY